MKIKKIILTTLIVLTASAGFLVMKPVLAQAPPAARFFFFIPQNVIVTDYRKVHVNISWTENGVEKHSDYYTIIRDLSK